MSEIDLHWQRPVPEIILPPTPGHYLLHS